MVNGTVRARFVHMTVVVVSSSLWLRVGALPVHVLNVVVILAVLV